MVPGISDLIIWLPNGRAIMVEVKNEKNTQQPAQKKIEAKIKAIGGYSTHGDQTQLLKWVEAMRLSVKKVFVVQGEEEESSALTQKIKDELAVEAIIPEAGGSVVL